MGSGGRRNRSGPPADPRSARSDQRGLSFNSLPAEGYDGKVPEFPLPTMHRTTVEVVEKAKKEVPDKKSTISLRRREIRIWRDVWELPQAAAWATPKFRWLWTTIAEYCRLKALVEKSPDSNATLVAQLHRYRDQIGLTRAGMRELGWDISDEVIEDPGPSRSPKRSSDGKKDGPQRRLRAV